MDQSEAPLLDALIDYRQRNRYGFTPPGHRQGRGTDDRVLEVLGQEPFRDDVLASGGLDDRRTTNKYLKRAEELLAEAVGADTAFFSTCGSSLSVKAAMMAVAGGEGGPAGRAGQPQVDRGRPDLLRRAATVDHSAVGRRLAPFPSPVTRAGQAGVGSSSRRGGRPDRQPESLRHLHRPAASPRSATSAASR